MGIAVTDPLGMFAQPLMTLTGGKRQVIADIEKLVVKYQPEAIVLGLPVEMSGLEGEQAKRVRYFAEQLSKKLVSGAAAAKFKLPELALFDERLTTVQADRILRDNAVNSRTARERVDQVSAAVILEGFLSSRPRNGNPP